MFEKIKRFFGIEKEPERVHVPKEEELRIRPGFDIRFYRRGVPGPLMNLDADGGKGLAEASRQTLLVLRNSDYDYAQITDNEVGMTFDRVYN